MKVKILFSYTELIIPKGCRKARNVSFDDGEVTIDVKEISAADAPVAILATSERDSKPFTVEYRWWKGRLWTSLRVSGGVPDSHSASSADWDYEPLPSVVELGEHHRLHNPGIYTDRSATRKRNIDALRDRIANILLIDGVTYCAASEPCYKVMTFGMGCNHGGTALMLDIVPAKITKSSTEYLFGLLDCEAGIAAATKTAIERGDDNNLPIVPHGPQFEVLIPEAIKLRAKAPKPAKPKVVWGGSSAGQGRYF